MRKVVLPALIALGILACSGSQGDSCEEEGVSRGECDDGLVCGKKSVTSDELVCLKQCSTPADCAGDEECADVQTLKGCRPRP